ncbi:MAG: YigZ family protein, partial [Limnochordales bacterium]
MSASPPAGSPALQAYRTLREFRSAEIVIKRSRFIGWGSPVETEEAALELLNQIRAEHPQATHHCYAYRVGLGTETVRFSDDGEPAGTAGLPMLAVLRKQNLDQVLATVVRYFGGIKLGAGGLVRAYTETTAQALTGADKVPIISWQQLGCMLPYPLEGAVRRALETEPVRHVQLQYGESVRLHLEVDRDHA